MSIKAEVDNYIQSVILFMNNSMPYLNNIYITF